MISSYSGLQENSEHIRLHSFSRHPYKCEVINEIPIQGKRRVSAYPKNINKNVFILLKTAIKIYENVKKNNNF